MKLNQAKTKIMLVNFTKKYQFVSRLKLKGSNLEQVKEAKVLGTIISDSLSWNANCANIVRKCNMRLQLLREVASFGTDVNMMKQIYIQIVRVILEGSCQVWHSSLSNKNRKYLERCQKMALRIILPKLSYKANLSHLNIETLENRRNILTLRFAKQAKQHDKLSHLFKKNKQTHEMNTRHKSTYSELALTERYRKSAIINMQNVLNKLKHD
jgi:hypothetical protein